MQYRSVNFIPILFYLYDLIVLVCKLVSFSALWKTAVTTVYTWISSGTRCSTGRRGRNL